MLQHRDYALDADQLGFATIGSYADGAFTIDRQARSMTAVYAWVIDVDGLSVPVRVGETLRVGGRFSSYNGWLGGRQWPGVRRNAREQEKARLTRLRLGPRARVIAVPVAGKAIGLAVEHILLDLWRPALDLNFEIAGSWGQVGVRTWSRGYDRAPQAGG